MAVNVEDAGFILKDTIMWIYGSGFPKATDISKQIDKYRRRDYVLIAKELGVLPKDANRSFIDWTQEGHAPSDKYWEEFKKVISKEDWKKIEREVIGKREKLESYQYKGNNVYQTNGDKEKVEIDITAPATPEAKLWEGYKSHGLKPAYEPIIMAIKPNEGSYAQNALKWGVAGLNIDGGRIPSSENNTAKRYKYSLSKEQQEGSAGIGYAHKNYGKYAEENSRKAELGRFPANIILECICEEVKEGKHTNPECPCYMLDEQSGELKSGKLLPKHTIRKGQCGSFTPNNWIEKEQHPRKEYGGDKGGASRFFYCAKASKKERGEGNNHPTVKPLKLMEYLCTLTKTPTGGIVLDPYMGSGTTGVACVNTGRKFIGIELDKNYYEIACKRINDVLGRLEK
jgi:site-specific DNA-methyltransferase (adenine-specific)